MTELLRKVFIEASRLTSEEQDAIAALLLEELESKRRWDLAFGASPDALSKLASDALDEADLDETQGLDPTRL